MELYSRRSYLWSRNSPREVGVTEQELLYNWDALKREELYIRRSCIAGGAIQQEELWSRRTHRAGGAIQQEL